jgi:hypothetical protein
MGIAHLDIIIHTTTIDLEITPVLSLLRDSYELGTSLANKSIELSFSSSINHQ